MVRLYKSVGISNLEDGVFYAQMDIESDSFGKRTIDARPSDAIAVALRMETTILVTSKILKEARHWDFHARVVIPLRF